MTREEVLDEIRRTALLNKGVPLGKRRFSESTGIRESDWLGKHWARWSDAVREAGFEPLALNQAIPSDVVIAALARLTKQFQRLPTFAEIRLAGQQDPELPDHKTFAKIGTRTEWLSRLHQFAVDRSDDALLAIVEHEPRELGVSEAAEANTVRDEYGGELQAGVVYLLKSGGYFKLGRTREIQRRQRDLAIQLPERLERIHAIRTDDTVGIEAYWHKRFAAKRLNGEWFSLSAADIRAFKRRSFM